MLEISFRDFHSSVYNRSHLLTADTALVNEDWPCQCSKSKLFAVFFISFHSAPYQLQLILLIKQPYLLLLQYKWFGPIPYQPSAGVTVLSYSVRYEDMPGGKGGQINIGVYLLRDRNFHTHVYGRLRRSTSIWCCKGREGTRNLLLLLYP